MYTVECSQPMSYVPTYYLLHSPAVSHLHYLHLVNIYIHIYIYISLF